MAQNKKKWSCYFTQELQKEFKFIEKTRIEGFVKCVTCHGQFSITFSGRRDIVRHIGTDKHKTALLAASSSLKVTNYFRNNQFGTKEKELAISEAVFSYHTIYHHHSFRSMDCTSKIIQILFEKKFSCARTKTEAIVKNILAPYIMEELKKELQNVRYVSIYSDASNHKDLKLFPTMVRYFNIKSGVNIKILDLVSLPGETSTMICNSIISILKKHNLSNKLVAYCADNANTNFGGAARKGTNNIFAKLNEELQQKLIGVGCAAHIIHNAIQHAADLLPVDIENIIIKMYGHFYIYTVRVNTLKEFCDDVEVEYRQLLGFSKTRWLALMPAIERILKMYKPLKAYFLSMEKCPVGLYNFFNKNCSELWLKFLHNQASVFYNSVKNVEGNNVTIIDVSNEINCLVIKYKERLEDQYIPLTLKNDLKILVESGDIKENWFLSHINSFYRNCFQYLQLWSEQFLLIEPHKWINLKYSIKWIEVQKSLEGIISNFSNSAEIDENALYDEISYVKNYADTKKINEWNEEKRQTDMRWVEIFNHFVDNNIPFQNIQAIIEYILCIPATNAPTERIFSIINKLWSIDKSQLMVDTVKAILMVKVNYASNCEDFLKQISNNEHLLKQVHKTEKYNPTLQMNSN